jgi:hypothetical protein
MRLTQVRQETVSCDRLGIGLEHMKSTIPSESLKTTLTFSSLKLLTRDNAASDRSIVYKTETIC